jgi:hypothetical protein
VVHSQAKWRPPESGLFRFSRLNTCGHARGSLRAGESTHWIADEVVPEPQPAGAVKKPASFSNADPLPLNAASMDAGRPG